MAAPLLGSWIFLIRLRAFLYLNEFEPPGVTGQDLIPDDVALIACVLAAVAGVAGMPFASGESSPWVKRSREIIGMVCCALGGRPGSGGIGLTGNAHRPAEHQEADGCVSGLSGALTSIAGSPFAGEKAPFSAAVNPSGKFAYVADTDGDVVSGYTINPATGALTAVPGSPFATGPAPISLAFSRGVPALHAVYITNEGSKSVSVINPSTKQFQKVSGDHHAPDEHPQYGGTRGFRIASGFQQCPAQNSILISPPNYVASRPNPPVGLFAERGLPQSSKKLLPAERLPPT